MIDWYAEVGQDTILRDGQRGTGASAGECGWAYYPPLTKPYPSCSKHGAMNSLGGGVWRCLAFSCNIGFRVARDDS